MSKIPKEVIYITVLLLFVGVFSLPYGYYKLLHIITTASFAWGAYILFKKKYSFFGSIYALVAILFNPIISIHLHKEIWVVIDIIAGIILLLTMKSVYL